MLLTYPAIDGFKLDGNEDFASLMAEDSIQGDNLLSNPSSVNSWTSDSDGNIVQQDKRTIKQTKTHASNDTDAYQGITTEADTWYLMRAYAASDDSSATCQLFAGTTLPSGSDLKNNSTVKSTLGLHEMLFKATGTTSYVHFQTQGSNPVNTVVYWSNIEVIKLNRYGVDETTDYISNGDFPTDTTGWTKYETSGAGSISVVAGALVVDNNSSATYTKAVQGITCVVGNAYKITTDIVAADSSASIRVTTSSSGAQTGTVCLEQTGTPGTYTLNFVATATTMYVALACDSATTTDTATFDNCVVTESGNLVGNDTFGHDTAWTKGTGWTISGGTATCDGTQSTSTYLHQEVSGLVYGYSYVVTYTLSGYSAGNVRALVGNQGYGTYRSANGTYSETIECSDAGGSISFYFQGDTNFVGSIDNVTVRRAYPVLDSNGNAAEIHGEIVEVPANYNSDTVVLANFSADNYLKMPYSSDLDPGTGDYSLSFWFKRDSISTGEYIYSRDSDTTAENYRGRMNSSGLIIAHTDDDSIDQQVETTAAYDNNQWHHVSVTYDDDTGSGDYSNVLYIDGEAVNTETGTSLGTLANTAATLIIGNRQALDAAFGGFIAGIKIDIGNLWTAQKIKSDYESEKVLYNQDELFSVVGQSIDYDIGAQLVDYGQESGFDFVKDSFTIVTDPFLAKDTPKAKKFIRSVNYETFSQAIDGTREPDKSFTFDLMGSLYSQYNPLTCYKISKNEQINGNVYKTFSATFRVR